MLQNWYAVYTRTHREKKVSEILTKKGIENYCPINYIVKQKASGKRAANVPLFLSYVFIHVSEAELTTLRNIPDVINLVYWKAKPAIINNEEINAVKQLTEAYVNIKLEKSVVNMEERLNFVEEPVIFFQENMVSVKYHSLKVYLPSLGYTMIAEREREDEEVIQPGINQFALLPKRISALFTN